MMARSTVYRLCGIWGMGMVCATSILIGLLILTQIGYVTPFSWIRLYLDGFLIYFIIGMVMFGIFAARPDIAEDLQESAK